MTGPNLAKTRLTVAKIRDWIIVSPSRGLGQSQPAPICRSKPLCCSYMNTNMLRPSVAIRPFLASLLLLGIGAFCSFSSTPASAQTAASEVGGIAAVVNDAVVTDYDVEQRLRLIIVTSGQQPPPEAIPRLRAQVLRTLVDEHLQLQKTGEFEIQIAKEEVDAQLEAIANRAGLTLEQIEADLLAQGIDTNTLRSQIRAEIAWQRLVSGMFGSRIRISDDQVDQVLERMSRDSERTQYLVSQIFLPVDSPQRAEEMYNAGVQLIGQMQQGVPFDALARQFSADPSAAVGGDIGWVRDGELPEQLNTVLTAMQPGQVSAPTPVGNGFYILALRDRRVTTLDGPEMWSLRVAGVAIPADANDRTRRQSLEKMERFQETVAGCSSVDTAAGRIEGVSTALINDISVGEISPAFVQAVSDLGINEPSEIVTSEYGVHVAMLCGRGATGGPGAPSRDAIEGRLIDQKLSMMSRRYLRDIRRESAVEMR